MVLLSALPMVYICSFFRAWSCRKTSITMLYDAPRARMSALANQISEDINGDFSSINNV
jgi:hypothetical protein